MGLVSQLQKVLVEDALETSTIGDCILLKEQQAEMTVEVVKLTAPIAIIDMNALSHMSALREGPWKKICDYLIVFSLEGKDHFVFVELKKTLSNETEPKEQLRRSLPFLAYLRSVCDIEYCIDSNWSNMSVDYLLIGEKASQRLDKQRVRVDSAGKPKPNPYKDITVYTFVGSRVSFATLLSM